MTQTKTRLFQPFTFKNGLTLRNRAVMAPMTTWSANPDGTISDQEVAYYRARANGVGMVVTGCTYVTPDGIGFTDEFAGHDDRFIPSLRRLSEAAKSGGAPAILQVFHAHGFLIQNFFSPMFNQRDDEWGGSLENRMRFPLAVVREAQRVIAEHAKRPFLLGYRVSPDEPGDGALRIGDTCVLIDRLIEVGVDYIHASLFNISNAKPVDYSGERTTAELLVEYVGDRVPLIAAGLIRTPEDAERALTTGLPLVAIGQGLVMNPTWVELAGEGRETEITTMLDPARVPQLAIPDKMWGVIQMSKGWFSLVEATQPVA